MEKQLGIAAIEYAISPQCIAPGYERGGDGQESHAVMVSLQSNRSYQVCVQAAKAQRKECTTNGAITATLT